MSALQIVLLTLGLLALLVLVLSLVRRWTDRKAAALRDELAASGERFTRAPEAAVYRGASGRFSMVTGNGVIALTERCVIFRKLIGEGIEVARAEIVAVREDKWFLRSYAGGRVHLILKLVDDTEIGFQVRDHAAWMAALQPR